MMVLEWVLTTEMRDTIYSAIFYLAFSFITMWRLCG